MATDTITLISPAMCYSITTIFLTAYTFLQYNSMFFNIFAVS